MSSLRAFINNFHLAKINLSLPIMDIELEFTNVDKEAAWALYVELITRSAIQPLPNDVGNEIAALESIYSIFPTTREILKEYGRRGKSFSKITIIVLNEVIRPFTSKWHKKVKNDGLKDSDDICQFRKELSELQCDLQEFVKILAEISEFDGIPPKQLERKTDYDS